jgi:FtsZ-interacting cell division protein ZipA
MHDEPLQKFQPRSTISTWVGIVLLFAFFALLALVVIGASPRGNTYEKKRAKARAEKLQAARAEMMTALTTYGWVDKAKGVAHIPVSDAMKLAVAELAQKTPAPANPIATPETQTPPPATSPSPAASPTPTASTTPKPTTITGPTSESHNQPAAAINPPPAPPNTQPGPSSTPAATPPSAPAKPQASPSPSAKSSPSVPASPLPVRGKTP